MKKKQKMKKNEEKTEKRKTKKKKRPRYVPQAVRQPWLANVLEQSYAAGRPGRAQGGPREGQRGLGRLTEAQRGPGGPVLTECDIKNII